MDRRTFMLACAGGSASFGLPTMGEAAPDLDSAEAGEDIFRFVDRQRGSFDQKLYAQILGAANEFKEGDALIGVAASNPSSRQRARQLLANTRLSDLDAHPPHRDRLFETTRLGISEEVHASTSKWTCGELKQWLLRSIETDIKKTMSGLSSDVIGCVVKLMTNVELIEMGRKIFNPLPGSQLGARGYLGARIQPNSPTDNLIDIRWQVLCGWSYAVGDVVLGTNPVSSEPASVAAIEATLKDLLVTFRLEEVMPHCVLSHIDVQAEVERAKPGMTALWFQSIAGTDGANATFDISVDQMMEYAATRTGRYGLYFETGQGADFTNGHGNGFDMLLHEARKYGFARVLSQQVAVAQRESGREPRPWVHLNDVAGFIGPEVFRSREQLVRCCLEDIVMGKLHGLCIGLDVCSTLHMDVTLDDLDWCLDQILPANPAYLMALPTKIDPMLGYLTTGFQDHVRLRDKFGYRVNDAMWLFFQELGVIDSSGRPTEHFGDPAFVYRQFRRRQGDTRPDAVIATEARQQMAEVRSRGVFLAEGQGAQPGELAPAIRIEIDRIYADAKKCIWEELPIDFVSRIPEAVPLITESSDRTDYILHPETGERLALGSRRELEVLREAHAARFDVQIVISDGLNALALTDEGQLQPFLGAVRKQLEDGGFHASPQHLIVRAGRVRAGYRIGETLFGGLDGRRAILHVIGERPGTGHHTFSIYITSPDGAIWGSAGQVDHNITRVVSGVARTALSPTEGAAATVRNLRSMMS